ncbi:MAG: hypothetical protein O2904_01295 [bacterium]|nr:hypothetical protein [bacterium]
MPNPNEPSIEALYQEIHESSELLDPSFVTRLSNHFKWLTVKTALGRRTANDLSTGFRTKIEEEGAFSLQCIVDESRGFPDLIFSNHQGPSDNAAGEGAEKKGLGMLDTLLSHTIEPKGTKTVLKKELTECFSDEERFRLNMKSISRVVRALAFRKMNYIALKRPSMTEFRQHRRTALKQFQVERERVWKDVCDIVQNKTPVKIYAEGTRSASGAILPVMKDLCIEVIRGYLQPQLRGDKSPRMDLQIVDTLQTFPNGLGSSVPAYQRPLLITRGPYEPDSSLMDDIEAWSGDGADLKLLGKNLAIDMQTEMELRLREILVASMEE